MNRSKATEIVESLLADLAGREGLGDEWYRVDEDVQKEIIAEWVEIVINEVNE